MKYYAGIGSRETPQDILLLMTEIAIYLRKKDWILRSGHASGADWAFEQGAKESSHIFVPWKGFRTKPYKEDTGDLILGKEIIQSEETLLTNYNYLIKLGIRYSNNNKITASKLLHGRNVNQILGLQGENKSSFTICWCPEINNIPQGGTATTVLLAQHYKIPIFNLWNTEDLNRIQQKLTQENSNENQLGHKII